MAQYVVRGWGSKQGKGYLDSCFTCGPHGGMVGLLLSPPFIALPTIFIQNGLVFAILKSLDFSQNGLAFTIFKKPKIFITMA